MPCQEPEHLGEDRLRIVPRSGLGVLRAASALAQRRNVVVLSNYATPDMRRKCLELGADRVFDKSNEIDALIQYCASLVAGHSEHGALT